MENLLELIGDDTTVKEINQVGREIIVPGEIVIWNSKNGSNQTLIIKNQSADNNLDVIISGILQSSKAAKYNGFKTISPDGSLEIKKLDFKGSKVEIINAMDRGKKVSAQVTAS